MKIRNFMHKGLQRLYVNGSAKGVPAATEDKLRDMLHMLEQMVNSEELQQLTVWKIHQLTGNRKGEWSLSVTRNWRLTFWIDKTDPAVCDVNLEDYH